MPIGNGGIIGPANVPTITTASGVWSLREQQQAQGRGAWPLALTTDPYFEYTTLLLPGNGTNGANNNTFLDGSTNNFTITRNGNTTQGTFSPFSQTGWGAVFGSSSTDMLTTASSAAFAFGTGDFTMEAFVYATASQTDNWIIGLFGNCWLRIGSAGKLDFYNNITSTSTLASAAMALNQWVHVAVVRSGTTLTIYENGSSVATASVSTNFSTSVACTIGNQSGVDRRWNGYISNARVVKGVAVYTGNFTPPTSPLAATQSAGTNISAITGTQTSLLTCQSNRFIDNSTNNFTITRNGSPSVVAFSPFNPTLPWSAATNGGSGYFDGIGDYLTTPDNVAFTVGSGNWTLEAWVYPTASPNQPIVFGQWSGGTDGSVTIALSNDGNRYLRGLVYSGGYVDRISGSSLQLNAWNHCAFVREGTFLNLYLNGSRVDNYSFGSGSVQDSSLVVSAGAASSGTQPFQGYICDCRFLKGTAQYTGATYTVPTAPLTAITNTSLLLNYTNAGIYDATSKNDLETLDNTVNGVRISTAQSQFGGSSIYFDGTGTDYLWIQADQPFQRFGTAPFTIELWIRLAATGSARGLVAKGTSTTGWLVSLNTSNQVVFTYGTSTITSTGTIPASAWRYIAVVREGTGANQTKIYISGVNDGTGTVSTDFTQTSSMYIGADRTGGSLFSGYIQDVRITNGYARTVTTIPTTAFPVI